MSLNLKLTPAGDLVIAGGNAQLVDDVAQRVATRLRMLLGEWFLNLTDGTPYFQTIFERGTSLELVRSAFRDRVAGTEGVRDVSAVVLDANRTTRKLSVTISAVGPTGFFTVSL